MTGVFAGELILDNQTIPVAICLGAEEGKCEFHALTNQPPQIDGEVILILQKQVSDLEPWQSIEQMRAKIHADIEKVRNYFDAI
jgi:FAD synthase